MAEINAANSFTLNHKFLTSELVNLISNYTYSEAVHTHSRYKTDPRNGRVNNRRIKIKQSSMKAIVKGKEG